MSAAAGEVGVAAVNAGGAASAGRVSFMSADVGAAEGACAAEGAHAAKSAHAAEGEQVRGGAGAPVVSERFDALGADGRPARLGIMGGTFDPIHIGHLACAEQAREAFSLDAVIFMPTATPAFKRDRDVASAEDRLAMCRLAVLPNPRFDVSAMEIARGGITYTIDTARTLRAHYPDNVELFFIVGADSALSLARWRESASLARLVRFIAVTRPGYALKGDLERKLDGLGGFDVSCLSVTALSISSSELRERARAGRTLRYLAPSVVCDYVIEHGLYRGEDASGEACEAGEVRVTRGMHEVSKTREACEAGGVRVACGASEASRAHAAPNTHVTSNAPNAHAAPNASSAHGAHVLREMKEVGV